MGKEVHVVCPSVVAKQYGFLGDLNSIKNIDKAFDFSPYDLLIATDTERWEHYGTNTRPKKTIINIH